MSGGPQEQVWLAGVEIILDSGFKTYWRTPGDSGLPPRFDWSGSTNVATVEVKWPAPSRHDDATGVSYIYHDAVILPVVVTPVDRTKPVTLELSIDYGVCKDICIPAHADLVRSLDQDSVQRAALQKAIDHQPRPQPLDAPGEISILSVEPVAADKPSLKVRVRAPAGSAPDLFAEGPNNWYFSTSTIDAEGAFIVSIEEKPKEAADVVPLRLTLSTGEQAVETDVKLDGNGTPR
ncbi:protein-disulfide reductase DsbD domain-containing protein [Microvirga puerhi]|uniref:Thiol:disulfide interchange protein DsbD N-terminal domain-containing protein n=1 Tax=Microvirga puerhi TaxID=2876078 RepID=A0ABS7VLA2_9HYPH|nr:protein-disulfide reductase DsbD domain-containing protein [Microvirga puerhi]MBZ6076014.1 hypothetical protein [Microvirga puerhi]